MFSGLISKIIPLKTKVFLKQKLNFIREFYFTREIKKIKSSQAYIVKELRQKRKLKVIFLALYDSVWKYEEVYRLLDKDPKFVANVVVCPLVRNGKADMTVYKNTLNYFLNNDYNVLPSYDSENDCWRDIKAITQPDIVFFTLPHNLTFDKYSIYNFIDKLTCYVPYAFVVIHLIEMHYNQRIHHYLWKYFVETKFHEAFAKKYAKSITSNVVVTGYPGLDRKFAPDYIPSDYWKPYLDNKVKKIIWAPHHSIEGQESRLYFSNFINYSDYFIELLKENRHIQMAFKPHPFLKKKLYGDKNWGKAKTDDYFETWNALPNGQLEEGAYLDLFALSDAMIMDSASFIVEYLYFNKPILFTMYDDSVKERFNPFGQMVFDFLSKAKNSTEIDGFITEVVIADNDLLGKSRNQFFIDNILPQNGNTASENIYQQLKIELQ